MKDFCTITHDASNDATCDAVNDDIHTGAISLTSRLDILIAQHTKLRRSYIQKQIRAGQCTVNNICIKKPAYMVKYGDTIRIHLEHFMQSNQNTNNQDNIDANIDDIDLLTKCTLEDTPYVNNNDYQHQNNDYQNQGNNTTDKSVSIEPVDLNLDILHEDKYIAIINKPIGIAVHHGVGNDISIINGLAYLYDINKFHGYERPFLVHRLDKDTSGILIIAKDPDTMIQMLKQQKQIIKHYIAVVHNRVMPTSGIIEQPIKRDPRNRLKMHVGGLKLAKTEYTTICANNIASVLKCTLHTGRMHQIRVHMQYIGHPIIGDTKYSHITSNIITRQALHAQNISFVHPMYNQPVTVSAKLPYDIQKLLASIGLYDVSCERLL